MKQVDVIIFGGGMGETGSAKGPVDLLPGRTPQRRAVKRAARQGRADGDHA
jgi:hypothetical protein